MIAIHFAVLCLFVKYVFSFSLFSSCHFLSLILTQDIKRLSLSPSITFSHFDFCSENINIVTIYKAGKGLFPPQALLSDWQLSLYFAFYTCVGFGWVIKALHCTVHSKSGQVSKHTVVKVCRLDNFSEETYHECTLGLS